MREIILCMQVLQAARRLSRAAHVEHCHWSERCNNNVGVTAGKASRNSRGVTAGKMGRNSSCNNNQVLFSPYYLTMFSHSLLFLYYTFLCLLIVPGIQL